MSAFAEAIIKWQHQHGRHDLPWQQNLSPYRVWVSEIMLQQTQVATVKPYYQAFMKAFPKLEDLAAADLDDVYALWSGLGYYSRARNLQACAQMIMEQHKGTFPMTLEKLQALPGIGAYTAGAILSICTDRPAVALDGNVRRILARHNLYPEWPGSPAATKTLTALMEDYLPKQNGRPLTQGLFDLGSMICTRSKPKCSLCPIQISCQAHLTGQSNTLPTPRPKKTKPIKEGLFVLATHEDQIALVRHFEKGVWQGLWRPLWLEADQNTLPKSQLKGFDGGYLKHVFSHYQLNMELVSYEIKNLKWVDDLIEFDTHQASEIRWLPLEGAFLLGLPSPVNTLLKRYASALISS